VRSATDHGGRGPARGVRRIAALLAACGLVVAFSAGTAAAKQSSSAGSDKKSEGLSKARASVRKYSQPPTSIGVTEPLPTSPQGKRVYYLEQDIPVMKLIGDEAEQAAGILGIEFTRVPAGSTPESWGRAFDRAVQDAPDVVLAGPIPAAVVGSQLAQLAAKQIPVVVWTSVDVPKPGNGITLNFDTIAFYKRQGRLMADWVTADSKGKAKAVLFNIPDFPSLAPLARAFESRLKSVCPGCSLDKVAVGAQSIGTELPGRVTSYLQEKPDTNYVVAGFGDMFIGVPDAVAGAGVTGNVKLVTQSGGQLNYQYVKSGQQAVEGATPFGLYSWKLMDTAARVVTGASPAPDQAELVPTQLLTKKDIRFNLNEPWPGVKDYQADFKKLWNVQSS
jgi:ribose transport system substrate-binding protein